MDIELNLQHPDEMEAFAAFLTATAASRRTRKTDPIGLFGLGGIDRANHALWQTATRQADEDRAAREAEDAIPQDGEQAAEDDKPKRTRRTKAEIAADAAKAAETVANLDPAVVAAAEAAGVHVQGPAATEDDPELPMGQEESTTSNAAEGGASEQETVVESTAPALTENDVRNSIIDLLNEAQAKFPADPDVRTKTLGPILAALGAAKISLIPMTEYPKVADILAKSRSAMDAALAEAA